MSMTKEQWLNMPVHVDPGGKKISTATTGSLITIHLFGHIQMEMETNM